jgi:hypothetical protein
MNPFTALKNLSTFHFTSLSGCILEFIIIIIIILYLYLVIFIELPQSNINKLLCFFIAWCV